MELTGTVLHPWQKFRAAWVAASVPGVRRVENLLLVDPVVGRTDEEITQELIASYLHDRYLDERTIVPYVEEGIVYLRGLVPTLLQRRLAGAIAWWRAGVRDVINELEVERFEGDDTREDLAEALMVVFDTDPLVKGSPIAVLVPRLGHVILTGTAGSPEQCEAAESDAWCLLGVHSVESRLTPVPGQSTLRSFGRGKIHAG